MGQVVSQLQVPLQEHTHGPAVAWLTIRLNTEFEQHCCGRDLGCSGGSSWGVPAHTVGQGLPGQAEARLCLSHNLQSTKELMSWLQPSECATVGGVCGWVR